MTHTIRGEPQANKQRLSIPIILQTTTPKQPRLGFENEDGTLITSDY